MPTLKEKIENVIALQKKIEEVAKPAYEEWHNALSEVVMIILTKTKKGQAINGIVTAPIELKFDNDSIYELRPNYVNKVGEFKNCVFKMSAGEMFTIHKIERKSE